MLCWQKVATQPLQRRETHIFEWVDILRIDTKDSQTVSRMKVQE